MRIRTRPGIALALALVVVLAGCAALPIGGGPSADGPSTDEPESDDGDTVDTDGSDADEGADADEPTAAGDDDGDADGTAMASPSSETATTAESGSEDSFSPATHVQALEAAGSYTLEFTVVASGGDGGGTFVGTQKTDLETGEQYATPTVDAGLRNISFKSYVPPNNDTAYRHAFGQTQSTPIEEANEFLNYSTIGANDSTGEWVELTREGSGETNLGSATIYGADSVDALPRTTRERYDSIESVRVRAWVDDETGAIAKYDYRLSTVDDGDEGSIRVTVELTDLGSTSIDRPDWVPDD